MESSSISSSQVVRIARFSIEQYVMSNV